MTKFLWKSLVLTPAILGAALVTGASAQDLNAGTPNSDTLSQINQYAIEGTTADQLRSVSQLSDVKPTDWAYQAVRSLVERYNCVAGYPDGTFRGGRAMTRYEAAALVNACMDTVNDLIAAATADLVTKEDLAVLQRLQEEFQAELATLRGRVDSLEARTAELEANQFSTTTKLWGEALFSLNDSFNGEVDSGNTVFGGRVRLDFNTSFTGQDLLRTRLEAENIKNSLSPALAGAGTGNLEYGGALTSSVDGGAGAEVSVVLDALWYRFPVGEKADVTIGPVGVAPDLFVPTTVWTGGFFSDYLHRTAIYEVDSDEAGFGGNYQVNDLLNIAAGYTADATADDPDKGVFASTYTGFTQLTATKDNFTGALTYAHEYNAGGTTGSDFWDGVGTSDASNPFGTAAPASSDTLGLILSYKFSPKFILQGYAAHSWMSSEVATGATADDSARSLAAGLGFIFPDALIEGNEAGIAFGLPPFIYDGENGAPEDENTPMTVDMYYTWKISDNISVTPGAILLFNGNGSGADADNFEAVTAIKTRFKF